MMANETQPILETNNIVLTMSKSKMSKDHSEYVAVQTEECLENGIDIIWKDLSFSVKQYVYKFICGVPYKMMRTEQNIVKNLYGKISSGKLTAILGPNGAGKSTLLECLGGRRKYGVTGQIYITNKG